MASVVAIGYNSVENHAWCRALMGTQPALLGVNIRNVN